MDREVKPIISVVVPVYNVERFLRRCIDSILNQDFESYEVILVDDGSKDSSGQICDEYARFNEKVIVIHKSNGGLSSARHEGFKVSRGEYICFLDSDDYVSTSILKDWYNVIVTEKCNVAICSYKIVSQDIIKEIKLPILKSSITNLKKDYILPLMGISGNRFGSFPSFLWLRLFKKDLIDSSFFVSEQDYYLEDLPFNLFVSEKIDKIGIINNANYYYCLNQESLTEKYRSNAWKMRCNLYDFIEEYCIRNKITNKLIFEKQFWNAITFTVKNSCKQKNYKLFIYDIKEMISTEKYKYALKYISLKRFSMKDKFIFYCLKLHIYYPLYLSYK